MTDPARREDDLRLSGSAGATTLMEAEFLRLVKRSPFEVRLPRGRREGDAVLLYPFDARLAWVAACHHRTSSRVAWELWSSPASRLEPLFDDLVELVAQDDRLDPPSGARAPSEVVGISVDVRTADDFEAGPLQLRGVVKNAVIEGLRRRGIAAELRPDSPDLDFGVRRAGADDARRTRVALDLGGGPRHRRGERVAMVEAPLRETLAAQLVMFSRWDARAEPLVDAMTGGGTIAIEAAHLATGRAVRQPGELGLARLRAFDGLPADAPDLFPGTVPRILASDSDQNVMAALVGNLRAAGLTGPEREKFLVLKRLDARDLSPGAIGAELKDAPLDRGVVVMNPPYGQRLGSGDEAALLALYGDVGRACARLPGWRVAAFVAHPAFREAFGIGFGRDARIVKPMSNAALRGWFLLFD